MHKQILLARVIAKAAHSGQVSKDGTPYILHPEQVAKNVEAAGGDYEMIAAAWLHDVVEDTAITYEDLLEAGVDTDVVTLVMALTHDSETQTYMDFIRDIGVIGGKRAVRIKLADIAHNMVRGTLPTEKQMKKYTEAKAYLEAML